MVSTPITIAPDCSVDEAMRIMTENRVRQLPVISHEGSISGIVSIGDLVCWAKIEKTDRVASAENVTAE